jgi:diguanylate cyclase (GGDEF)-like protein
MLRSLVQRAGHHRLELIIVLCAIAAVVAVAASARTTTRTFARSESWRHATGSLVAFTAQSHIWVEELGAGDTTNDPDRDVLAPLARARELCDGLRSGATTATGRVEPVLHRDLPRVITLCRELDALTTLTRRRLADPDRSGAGTAIDARYDAVFKRIERTADTLGDELALTVRDERRDAQRLSAGLLLSLLVLFATMGVMGRRHVRERLVRQRLEGLARTDALTGLANHRHFQERLRAELDRAQREASQLTLIVLDVDHFAALNDDRGHRFGDRVLTEIAATLAAGVRASDVVARLGGGRFAVLLPGSSGRSAGVLADALRARIARLCPDGCAVAASAGVASVPGDATDASALIEAADGALQWAKRDGRDRTRRYDPVHVQSRSLQKQRAEILALLEDDDVMRPVFQPVVALDTGEVAGYEALTRFRDPAGGSARWFEQARRCGLGGVFEARAIRLALAASGRPEGCFVTINVSPSGILSGDVLETLPDDLDGIVIELTENETADAPELAGRLDHLRERGALIAVDDAGAGHAGLQQLMNVRPDIVKLDRALVDGIAHDPVRAALIECFAGFARRTGTAVCAEGIERYDDLVALASLGVRYGQGYRLARPAAGWPGVAPEAAAALGAVAAPAAS